MALIRDEWTLLQIRIEDWISATIYNQLNPIITNWIESPSMRWKAKIQIVTSQRWFENRLCIAKTATSFVQKIIFATINHFQKKKKLKEADDDLREAYSWFLKYYQRISVYFCIE